MYFNFLLIIKKVTAFQENKSPLEITSLNPNDILVKTLQYVKWINNHN